MELHVHVALFNLPRESQAPDKGACDRHGIVETEVAAKSFPVRYLKLDLSES